MKHLLPFVLLLAACDDPTTAIITPNGKPGYVVHCQMDGEPACYEKIGIKCPNGYTIIEGTWWWKMVECKPTAPAMF